MASWTALLCVIVGLVTCCAAAPAQAVPLPSPAPVESLVPSEAAAELRTVSALLDDCARRFDGHWSANGYGLCDQACTRLAVFQDRFARDPRSLPEWEGVTKAAARALSRVEALVMSRDAIYVPPDDDRSTFTFLDSESPKALVRASLQLILGRTNEAARLAATVDPSGNDGCLSCTSDNLAILAARQAEIEEQRGDATAALHFALVAMECGPACVFVADWTHYRAGRCLERSGHVAEARAVWEAGLIHVHVGEDPEADRKSVV